MPFGLGEIAGAATGLLKVVSGMHQNHLANKVVVPEANYETSPYAAKMLEEANRIKNSRMPGANNAANGIYGAQANTTGAIGRNATSGSQALAMLAASQGTTDNAFNGLNAQENQWQENSLNNWNNANQGMISEGDKVFQDKVRKQQNAINEKNALRGAGTQNIGNGLNDFTSLAFMHQAQQNGDNWKSDGNGFNSRGYATGVH